MIGIWKYVGLVRWYKSFGFWCFCVLRSLVLGFCNVGRLISFRGLRGFFSINRSWIVFVFCSFYLFFSVIYVFVKGWERINFGK